MLERRSVADPLCHCEPKRRPLNNIEYVHNTHYGPHSAMDRVRLRAASWVGAGEGDSNHNVCKYMLTSRAYHRSQRVPVASPMAPPATPVLATSRTCHWSRGVTDVVHQWWWKVPIGRETHSRGRRGRSVLPTSSRPHTCVRHAYIDHRR